MASSLSTKHFLGAPSSSDGPTRLGSVQPSSMLPSRSRLQLPTRRSQSKRLEMQASGGTFGTYYRVTTFGESHGGGVGVAFDGCPLRLPLSEADMQVGRNRSSLQFFQKYGQQRLYQMHASCHLLAKKRFHGPVTLKVSSSSENRPASVLESEISPALFDESKIIKNKSEEIEPYLDGRCIYLVGMMGSGKTTVGKVLSEAVGYSFVDCDTLIEEAVGVCTVSEIFKLYGENFFRDNETEVLQKLSLMHRLVVSTGGGVVVRPINWRHMKKGISVWLDVPLEALARRITSVGTDSRPLLQHGSGDPYTKTMKRLSTLFEERDEAYANADVRVSLENMAVKLGFEDVGNISPTAIAIEVLLQIENFLKK